MDMPVPINHYLILSAVLFSIGVVGVLTRRNAIIIYMSIELMFNSANLVLVAFSRHLNDMSGHVFVFMVIAVAAAEAAVGLAIIIAMFRNKSTVDVDDINILKG